jgi:hypothetical protein
MNAKVFFGRVAFPTRPSWLWRRDARHKNRPCGKKSSGDPTLRILTNSERWLLLLLKGLFIFATANSAVATDETSHSSTAASVIKSGSDKAIAGGFTVERYAQLWERNPFTLVKTVAPPAQPSAFEKLFLASWLNDGGKDLVIVQNLETNETEKITAEPNGNNLRLVEMRPNLNPQFAEAVISNGAETGIVKFRFDAQAATAQTPSFQAVAEGGNTGGESPPNAQTPKPLPNTSTSQVPVNRVYPGIPRVHSEGGTSQVARHKKFRREQISGSPVPEQSTPDQN